MTAVVISAYTMGLAVIRSLGRRGVTVVVAQYDSGDYGVASRYVSRVVRVPHPVRDESAFVGAVMDLGLELDSPVLIPASDAALAAVARSYESLSTRYRVGATPWEQARMYLEKDRTYAAAAAVGVAVPTTHLVRSLSEAHSVANSIGFPILLKPTVSHLFVASFGTKMLVANSSAELEAAFRRTGDPAHEMMLQEIIPGPPEAGANYNSYVVSGRPIAEFTARKIRNAPSEFGSPRVVVAQRIPDLIEAGRKLIDAIGHTGFSCSEFKLNPRTGAWTLMEVNGRHNLSGALAVRVGIDFPWLDFQYLRDGVAPDVGPRFDEGVYWIDLARDVGTTLSSFRTEGRSFRRYIEPYVRPHVFADWDGSDRRPMLARAWRRLMGERPV